MRSGRLSLACVLVPGLALTLAGCVEPPVDGATGGGGPDSGGNGSTDGEGTGDDGDSGGGDSGDDGGGDDTGGDPRVSRGCVDGRDEAPLDPPESWLNASGSRYLVVQLESDDFDELYAMVVFSPAGDMAYETGAPVAVVVPPSMDLQARWDTNPSGYFRSDHGLVEVQPVLPGWSIQGHATSGPVDFGGEGSAMAVAEALRFALGELATVEGWSLPQLTWQPVCQGGVALLGNSSGGHPATRALELVGAELGDGFFGYAGYENPSLPQFALTELGGIWMDPDPDADADGNGVSWDDGRNPRFVDGTCTVAGCEVDTTTLRYEAELTPAGLFPDAPVGSAVPGFLYLDGNGNGVVDVTAGGSLDLDGDGLVEASEDWVFLPHVDSRAETTLLTHSPMLVAAAEAQGLFETSGWPQTLRGADETRDFWEDLELAERVVDVAPVLDAQATVLFAVTERPHGVSIVERPQLTVPYDAWLAAGRSPRLNPSPEIMGCASRSSALSGWAGGPEAGAALAPADIAGFTIPEDVPVTDLRAASVLQIFAERWGPPEHCYGD